MPALRNRAHLINGQEPKSSNGLAMDPTESLLNKKLLLLEEHSNESNNNSYHQASSFQNGGHQEEEESFADAHTFGAHAGKFDDEEPLIFNSNGTSMIRTARDQFAIALLSLQADLEATSRRLAEIETKVSTVNKQQQQQNLAAAAAARSRENAKGGLFNKENLTSLVYLSWPVVVFFAIRAIERRSMAAKMA